MKTLKTILALVAVMMAAVSCGAKQEAPQQKVLVLYYSQTQNTKTVAQEIASKMGADVEEIVPVKPYDGDFDATIARCMQEREQGVKTELQPLKSDLSQYDVIFLGFPVWFGTMAPPVAAFLDGADLSGKKVVPFCTFGSGGLVTSTRDLKAKQPGAEVLPGYGVRAARMKAVPQEVDEFLKAGGFIDGQAAKLEEFPAAHAVSADESKLFDAAVGDYPMIKARATAVSSRQIPGGTEYLFTAANLPQPGGDPNGGGEIKVYVKALDGQAPEFTQVLR